MYIYLIWIIILFLFAIIYRYIQFTNFSDITNLTLALPNLTTTNCLDSFFDSIVCICLPERKNYMISVFKQWNIRKVTFFDAFLRTNYTHQDFIDNNFITEYYNPRLNLGRICCHYSAMTVYQNFLNSNHESIFIFEDDLYKDTYLSVEHFNLVLEPVLQNVPKNWQYLNFSKCHDYCFQNYKIENNKYWTIPKRPLCRSAIALKKNAAKMIVNETQPMSDMPGDKMISNLITEKRFNAYATKNLYFYQYRERFGSTLDNVHKTNPPKCAFGR